MDERLSEAIDELGAKGPKGVLVALDFDGTLAPFVDDPLTARPLPEADDAVRRLADVGVTLALVSGRNLSDLAERATPPVGTHLIGSHGAERGIEKPEGLWTDGLVLTDDEAATHAALVAALREAVLDRPGAWVQVKPSAAVVHTRQAAPEDAAAATEAAKKVADEFDLPPMVGKNVVEIAVVATSKGQALDDLRRELESADEGGEPAERAVLFAGDDTTDENGFAVLRPGDVGIKVGDGETAAQYRVASPAELAQVLVALADRWAHATTGRASSAGQDERDEGPGGSTPEGE